MNAARNEDHRADRPRQADAPSREGLRDLMQAVLLDAIKCVRGRGDPPEERERLAEEARRWMTSGVRTWPFSFESICDVLTVSAPYLRRMLLQSAAADRPADGPRVKDMLWRLSALRRRGNQRTRITASRPHRRRTPCSR